MKTPEQQKTISPDESILGFEVCRLQLSCGDYHVGKISHCKFFGHQLTLVLAQMVKVMEVGSETDPDLVVTNFREDYTFIFDECQIIEPESNVLTRQIRSIANDVITLSNDPMVVVEIESIIAQKD